MTAPSPAARGFTLATTPEEKQAYLQEMVRTRGYVSRSHTLLANYDLNALKAFNPVPMTVYVAQRSLACLTKELCLVVGFAALRGPPYAMQSHMRKAVSFGASESMLLQALELLLPEAGASAVEPALRACRDVFARPANLPQAKEFPVNKNTSSGAAAVSDSAPAPSTLVDMLRDKDPAVARAIEGLLHEVQDSERLLDAKTKSLLAIMAMACLRAPVARLESQMRHALASGLSAQEILETLELAIPHAGLLAFEHGLTTWASVVDAKELQVTGGQFTPR